MGLLNSKNLDDYLKQVSQLAAAKTSHEQAALQRQLAATDRQIDRLVYALYELTEREITIVEDES